MEKKIDLDSSWLRYLHDEFEQDYMLHLMAFIQAEIKNGKELFPPSSEIFNALNLTPFPEVKVVIIGQDPYHGRGQANGLCFSVSRGVAKPPSLVNIFKELESDLHISSPQHGCLEDWAKSGVLLLNTVLTVEEGKAASHAGRGWELFTNKVVQLLNCEKKNLVFILWGAQAQKFGATIDPRKHCIIKSSHPSPLSVYRGFLGSKPFSQTNSYLKSHGKTEINWEIK